MPIYLDANALRDGLSTVRATALRVVARGHGLELVVPTMALSEAQANRRRLIEERAGQLDKALRNARPLFPVPTFDRPDAPRLSADWAHQIANHVRLLEVTDRHAMGALHREIQRIAPAHQGTEARDAALWLAILEDHRAKNEVSYLLSADAAFADSSSGEPRLHPDLRTDLAAHEPIHLAPGFEHVLNRLARIGGREFTVEEVAQDRLLPILVAAAIATVPVEQAMVETLGMAGGLPNGATSVSYSQTPGSIIEITRQTVFELGAGRDVAVIDATWRSTLGIVVTAGSRGVQAGRIAIAAGSTARAAVAVVVPLQLWARREGSAAPTFEVGAVTGSAKALDVTIA